MTRIIQLVLVLLSYQGFVQAQQHVHGQGSLFIIQDGEYWQMQFTLPASDALGFEHAAEDPKQQAAVSDLKQRLMQLDSLLELDQQCSQQSISDNLSAFDVVEHKHNDEHKHKHHDHHQHADEAHEQHSKHQDIQVSYVLKCPAPIATIGFSLFNSIDTLETFDIQWSIATGQGSATVSQSSPRLDLE